MWPQEELAAGAVTEELPKAPATQLPWGVLAPSGQLSIRDLSSLPNQGPSGQWVRRARTLTVGETKPRWSPGVPAALGVWAHG